MGGREGGGGKEERYRHRGSRVLQERGLLLSHHYHWECKCVGEEVLCHFRPWEETHPQWTILQSEFLARFLEHLPTNINRESNVHKINF